MTFLQYITPSRLAGAEYFFLRVIAHLAEMGHRVIVVTKRDTPIRAEIEKINHPNIELHAWHTHGKVDPITLAKLCRLIVDERVDVINTHLTTASWQGALAAKITGVPGVAVVHATDRKTWFQHADHLIAVSSGVKDSLIEQGIAPEKIEVLYHGIDLEQYIAPLDTASAKARLGLPADALTVGVVASLIPRKGHRFLLEALKNIKTASGPVHLLLAGEGPLEAELRGQVLEMGLAERVHFLGFRRDIPEIVCALDVFVLPSLKEGLSIAVMEAMALEKPVICSAIAGLPEVVRDGETGFLVPPGDSLALQNALDKLLSDESLRAQIGRDARHFLEANFEQTACLNAMESYFRRVVETHQVEKARGAQKIPAPRSFRGADAAEREAAENDAPASDAALTSYFNLPPARSERELTILQYITPSRIGGAERYFLRMVTHLVHAGHRVLIVTKRDAPLRLELEKLNRALHDEGYGLHIYAWHTRGKVDPLTLSRLVRLIGRWRVDVINTHLTTASWQGALAGKITGVPVVARVPATEHPYFYQFADQLIAVSHAVRRHLIEAGVPAKSIAVLYNGIDLEANARTLPPARAKEQLGLPPDARVIGIAASLIARKGHRFLLRAVAPLQEQYGPLHLAFAGEGELEDELRAQARELGMEDRVHFLGFRAEILDYLSALDIFVLPSLKEGLSNAVMEAMALELPVIVTRVAGMPEIVRDGETGLLVPPNDVEALQVALERLLSDPESASAMGRAGRAFLREHLDQQSCLEDVETYLRRVADSALR